MKVVLILIIIISCLSLNLCKNLQNQQNNTGTNSTNIPVQQNNGIQISNNTPSSSTNISDNNLAKLKEFLIKNKKKINQNITFVIPDDITCKDDLLITCISKCKSFYKIKTCSDSNCLCINNRKLRKKSQTISLKDIEEKSITQQTVSHDNKYIASPSSDSTKKKLRIQSKTLLEMYKSGIKELIESNKNFKPNFLSDPNSSYHTLNNENEFKQILQALPDLVDSLN